MNIEGGALVSLLQNQTTVDGRGQALSLLDAGALPEEFKGALMEQLESLADAKGQGQFPVHTNISPTLQPSSSLTGYAELTAMPGDPSLHRLMGKPATSGQPVSMASDLKSEAGQRAEPSVSAAALLPTAVKPNADKALQTANPAHAIIDAASPEPAADLPVPETAALQAAPVTQMPLPANLEHHSSALASASAATPTEAEAQNPTPAQSLPQPRAPWPEFDPVSREGGAEPGRDHQYVGVMPSVVSGNKPRQEIDAAIAGLDVSNKPESLTDSKQDDEIMAAALYMLQILPAAPAPAAEVAVNAGPAGDETGRNALPQTFVRTETGAPQAQTLNTGETAETAPQTKPDFGQAADGFTLPHANRAEKALRTDAVESVEAKPSASEFGKTLSAGISDMIQANRPAVETKVEVPPLTRPLTHPGWQDELGERVVWMRDKELSAAEIRLNPQHLGPILVRIEMKEDQASILFTSPHAAVVDALEGALPKLREMMSTQQVNLADVNISQNASTPSGQQHQSPQQQTPRNFENFTPLSGHADAAGEEIEDNRTIVGKGLLNTYA